MTRYISEEDIRHSESEEGIRSAVQARLAVMNYHKDLHQIFLESQFSCLPKFYLIANFLGLDYRNERLISKANKRAFNEHGLGRVCIENLYATYKKSAQKRLV
ncbi:MAG: hypothetical protein ACMXYK_03770 [Candidatus Woesearchaeota archaeon]